MPETRPAANLNGTPYRNVPLSREARAPLQLKRIESHNLRQQEELSRERVPVSVAAMRYCLPNVEGARVMPTAVSEF